jgi:hypothetical protein
MLSTKDSIPLEQLQLPGMGGADRRGYASSAQQDSPTAPDVQELAPKILKPEGGELSPWQKMQLDREYVQIADAVADTEIKREAATARIREGEENRRSAHWDRDQRRLSTLETERWERMDRRVERYAMLVVFLLATVATILLSFLTFHSHQAELRIAPGMPSAIALAAALRLRVLSDSSRTSIWDWLIRREVSAPATRWPP